MKVSSGCPHLNFKQLYAILTLYPTVCDVVMHKVGMTCISFFIFLYELDRYNAAVDDLPYREFVKMSYASTVPLFSVSNSSLAAPNQSIIYILDPPNCDCDSYSIDEIEGVTCQKPESHLDVKISINEWLNREF